jgi:proteic killer suppression protein
MIRSFRDKETEKVFRRVFSKKIPNDVQRVALRRLLYLHGVQSLEDLRVPPSNRLEKLTGDREGQFSIRINRQWRICFFWQEGDAFQVEIVDYH